MIREMRETSLFFYVRNGYGKNKNFFKSQGE